MCLWNRSHDPFIVASGSLKRDHLTDAWPAVANPYLLVSLRRAGSLAEGAGLSPRTLAACAGEAVVLWPKGQGPRFHSREEVVEEHHGTAKSEKFFRFSFSERFP